ncbi:prolyl aminopeptidase [Acaricomes phytoseiuli]|uniref:prolyl aminopeptidase n=1 Tax=Acaricomes phytoseiuli TaxID=291968 RepID=UPI0003635C60|nr:prolyl aminopeptidase [Acaricomes phytoseiuli]MCW1249708.1 prolyl aminopeptidase [Acaricomes phytoseiuli]
MQLYPPLEPDRSGLLDTGDGHQVYWETSGNPQGTPVLLLHGGPGSGSTPGQRRLWNPEQYRIVQMDQRQCGRSLPSAADPAVPLTANTTAHLLADIEQLREALGISRWVLWGGSWGVTLALAYAQQSPERVRALVLISVTTTRRSDVHWLYHEAGRFFPRQWQEFAEFASQSDTGVMGAEARADLVAAYHHLLNVQEDPHVRAQAAQAWCDWEDAVLSLEPGWKPSPRYQEPAFRMQFARIVTHYFHHGAWLAEGQLLEQAWRLAGIPGVLIHGRLDIGSPADVPWQLSRAWPEAELHLVTEAGHAGNRRSTELMLAAAQRFAAAP